MNLRHPNRIKSREPTKAKWWCRCDMRLAGHIGRCHVCGAKEKGRKDKKPGPRP